MTKAKMIPGKGFQYTPKKNVQWADEFNKLLANYSSRNDLISKLIEDGLAVQNGSRHKGKGIYISLDNFSDEQLLILNSEHGQKILNNLISSMLGGPSNASIVTQLSSATPIEAAPESDLDEEEQPSQTRKRPEIVQETRQKEKVVTQRRTAPRTEETFEDEDELDPLEALMQDASLTDI